MIHLLEQLTELREIHLAVDHNKGRMRGADGETDEDVHSVGSIGAQDLLPCTWGTPPFQHMDMITNPEAL